MGARHSIADVASLLGEPTRAAMLLALLDGRALPAGVLAREAQLSASATSLHLAKLTAGGLVVVIPSGRHRYYRLASPEVAHALESLGVLATRAPAGPPASPLRAARTCYDHLAGEAAVELAARLEHARCLVPIDERHYEISPGGVLWFEKNLKIDVNALTSRRAIARRCLDWTERRYHLAGALGARVLERLIAGKWLARTRDTRAMRLLKPLPR